MERIGELAEQTADRIVGRTLATLVTVLEEMGVRSDGNINHRDLRDALSRTARELLTNEEEGK